MSDLLHRLPTNVRWDYYLEHGWWPYRWAAKDHQFRPNIHRCLELDPKVWAKVFK